MSRLETSRRIRLVNHDVVTDPISLSPKQASGPLFVLSVFRSGSTLLYALLNQHSQISLLYEADLPRMELFLRGHFGNGSWRQRWEFWNQGASRHGIALDSLPAEVSDVQEATRIAYQSVARRKQATIWGEKTPRWYDSPLRRAEKFPDARFIFLWRDLHGVIGSIVRAAATERSFGKAGLAREVLVGTERLRQACDALKAQGKPVHEVNYEDLTASTPACMRQICEFLEIPFEERMTSLEGADRSAISPGECHTLVKRDRIVDQREKPEPLSLRMRAKIDRYIYRWKRRTDGVWPKYPAALPKDARPPSFSELWRDRIIDESAILWEKVFIVLLHHIRPLVYPKKYVRPPKAVSQVVGGDSSASFIS
jgi:Sulfotransferase family